jgi:hypothetical protein
MYSLWASKHIASHLFKSQLPSSGRRLIAAECQIVEFKEEGAIDIPIGTAAAPNAMTAYKATTKS